MITSLMVECAWIRWHVLLPPMIHLYDFHCNENFVHNNVNNQNDNKQIQKFVISWAIDRCLFTLVFVGCSR